MHACHRIARATKRLLRQPIDVLQFGAQQSAYIGRRRVRHRIVGPRERSFARIETRIGSGNERTLQIATVHIHPHAALRQFAPDAGAQIGHEISERVHITGPISERLELHEAVQAGLTHEPVHHRRLSRTEPVNGAFILDPTQQRRLQEHRRHLERGRAQVAHRLALTGLLHGAEALASPVGLLRVRAPNHRDHMVHVAPPLADGFVVQRAHFGVALPRLLGNLWNERHHTLEILHAKRGRPHGICITDGFREILWITGGIGGGEAQPRKLFLRARPLIERGLFVVRSARRRNRRIPPLHGEHIVRAHLRQQQMRRNAVLRLRHVVEARVVHERGDVAVHALQERTAPNRVHGILRRRLHVVRKADRVSHFVRHHVFHEPSHERIGHGQLLRTGIERRHLNEVPVLLKFEDVVIHVHFTLENLPRPRVHDLTTGGVGHGARTPVDHGVPRVEEREVRILLGGGRDLPDDGIAEAGLAERILPLVHAAHDPRLEPVGRGGIDPVHDLLHRIRDRGVGILLLELEAMNEAHLLGLVRGARHIVRTAGVETDTLIVPPRHHWYFGEAQHAELHARGLRTQRRLSTTSSAAATARGRRSRLPRLRDFDVHVLGERPRLLHPAARAHDPFHGCELRNVGEEQIADVHHGRTVGPVRGDGVGGEHRTLPEARHLAPDRRRGIRHEVVLLRAQDHAIPIALPLHNHACATTEEAGRILQRRLHRTADQEHLAIELA